MGIELDKPLRVLRVLEVIMKDNGDKVVRGIARSWGEQEVKKVMGYCRVWNTRARNCRVAQFLSKVVFEEVGVKKLIDWNVDEEIACMVGYTERHFKRLDEMVEKSWIVDYVLEGMGVMEDDVIEEEEEEEEGMLGIEGSGEKEMEIVNGGEKEVERVGGEGVVVVGESDSENEEDDMEEEEEKGEDIDDMVVEGESSEEEEVKVDFSKLKVPEIKEELKKRGLSVKGKKKDLHARLLDHES